MQRFMLSLLVAGPDEDDEEDDGIDANPLVTLEQVQAVVANCTAGEAISTGLRRMVSLAVMDEVAPGEIPAIADKNSTWRPL